MVKGCLKYSFLFALLVTPLFAKTYTVTIPQVAAVGSTQIPAGEYKLAWEGDGPAVRVTLSRAGVSPIVLNAKVVVQKSSLASPSVVTAQKNGVLKLQQIQLKANTLVFEEGAIADK